MSKNIKTKYKKLGEIGLYDKFSPRPLLPFWLEIDDSYLDKFSPRPLLPFWSEIDGSYLDKFSPRPLLPFWSEIDNSYFRSMIGD